MRYPEFLKDNGTIGFVAPSFGCATEPYYTAFQNALKNFHTMGFQTEIGPNCLVEQGVGIRQQSMDHVFRHLVWNHGIRP